MTTSRYNKLVSQGWRCDSNTKTNIIHVRIIFFSCLFSFHFIYYLFRFEHKAKLEGKKPLAILRHRLKLLSKYALKEIVCNDVNHIYLAWNWDQRSTVVNMISKFQVPEFLLSLHNSPQWAKASTLSRIHIHTQTHYNR